MVHSPYRSPEGSEPRSRWWPPAWDVAKRLSQAERVTVGDVDLDADERAWLEERLREYRDLLIYLHDH